MIEIRIGDYVVLKDRKFDKVLFEVIEVCNDGDVIIKTYNKNEKFIVYIDDLLWMSETVSDLKIGDHVVLKDKKFDGVLFKVVEMRNDGYVMITPYNENEKIRVCNDELLMRSKIMNEIRIGDYVVLKDRKFDGMLFEVLEIRNDRDVIINSYIKNEKFMVYIDELQLAYNFNTNVHGETETTLSKLREEEKMLLSGFAVVRFEKRKHPEAEIKWPTRATRKSMAYDIFAPIDYVVQPNETVKIWTDVKVYCADGQGVILNVRSSMGGIFQLANTQGWIDGDYVDNPNNDGNIGVFLKNISDETQYIKVGQAIGQLMFVNFGTARYGAINSDDMRVGGFGSTDK